MTAQAIADMILPLDRDRRRYAAAGRLADLVRVNRALDHLYAQLEGTR